MEHRSVLICILTCVAVLIGTPLHGQWVENGAVVCAYTENQQCQGIISDGEGGAFIVWRDNRSGNWDIYAQRIDGSGETMWAAAGVAVCTATNTQMTPRIIADGAGGVIIVWKDARGTDNDIYAQRLDGDGNAVWTAGGVAICTATGNQEYPELTSDDAGGAIIAWTDGRGTDKDIYAQRVASGGSPLWTTDGEPVSTAGGDQMYPAIVDDGAGGAVIAWRDGRYGNEDIFIQRLGSHGGARWTVDGEEVCTEAGSQRNARLLRIGAATTLITWSDNRGGDWDIYMQRFDSAGNPAWKVNGIVLCAAVGDQYDHEMVHDAGSGAIITWKDMRGGIDYDIYAQRVSSTGSRLWISTGVPLCTAPENQQNHSIAADGSGGAIVAWQDWRNDTTDVYIQRVDGDGDTLWAADGVAVSVGPQYKNIVLVTEDGNGGAIVAWSRTVLTEEDCLAQRIEKNGYWGYPAPSISDVSDVPGDQGGFVHVTWDASRLDPWPEQEIDFYTVWRSVPEGTFLCTIGAGGLWEVVDTIDAQQLESYESTVPTLNDSTASEPAVHYFQVIAHGFETEESWVSEPDSGWSVDNLAPLEPQNLAGTQSFVPEGLTLTWDPNTEPDLAYYSIYRDTVASFVPDEDNLITTPTDSFYFDDEWRWYGGYYYKVSATDSHGNGGAYASLGPNGVTGDEAPAASFVNALAQNYPNPFNPVTKIGFSLGAPANVSLCIYDAAGRLVRRLCEGKREAGRHEEIWDGRDGAGRDVASGIYFYRLVAGGFVRTRKMVMLR